MQQVQSFKDNDVVTLKLPNGQEIKGEYDMEMDGKIDDVKSASPWSYKNKFASFDALAKVIALVTSHSL